VKGAVPSRESIVVVQFGGQRAGIVVDQLMGEFQTVIKPLGRLFANLRGIGGSTILGSGEVALILDVAALVNLVARGEEERMLLTKHNASIFALASSSSVVQTGR
jgi:two-component system chemotaxis sensor kinase CheA